MTSIVQGTVVPIVARFFDADRNPVTPAGAKAVISYQSASLDRRQRQEIPMTMENGTAVGAWDTTDTAPGGVSITVSTIDDNISRIAVDGGFTVTANDAHRLA